MTKEIEMDVLGVVIDGGTEILIVYSYQVVTIRPHCCPYYKVKNFETQ